MKVPHAEMIQSVQLCQEQLEEMQEHLLRIINLAQDTHFSDPAAPFKTRKKDKTCTEQGERAMDLVQQLLSRMEQQKKSGESISAAELLVLICYTSTVIEDISKSLKQISGRCS